MVLGVLALNAVLIEHNNKLLNIFTNIFVTVWSKILLFWTLASAILGVLIKYQWKLVLIYHGLSKTIT